MAISNAKELAKALELGLEIIVSLIIPILLGLFVDRHYSFSPWGILIGVIIALLCAFTILFKFGVSKK